MGLTVAVTGPTGEIGTAAVRALESEEKVERILGMARRPFDPASRGWRKTEYRQGDILDRAAVEGLVADADVVVHLAYIILGSRSESERVNLEGTRNVFEATVAGAPGRLVYTSSVAAYGYYADNPVPLTEDVPVRGSAEHYYSAQKAACEALLAETTAGSDLEVYVLRPSIVAGPEATMMLRSMPWEQLGDRVPGPVKQLLSAVPGVRPALLDPGIPFQLVHHDDVADAIRAASVGTGQPGPYNLAAEGEVTMGDVANAIGAYAVPVPQALVDLTAELVARVPYLPAQAEWIHAARRPMAMDTARARRELGWNPRHTTMATLAAMASAVGS